MVNGKGDVVSLIERLRVGSVAFGESTLCLCCSRKYERACCFSDIVALVSHLSLEIMDCPPTGADVQIIAQRLYASQA